MWTRQWTPVWINTHSSLPLAHAHSLPPTHVSTEHVKLKAFKEFGSVCRKKKLKSERANPGKDGDGGPFPEVGF